MPPTPPAPPAPAATPAPGIAVRLAAPMAPVAGLYVHIPFCFHKCHYCDFYSIVDRPGSENDRQQRFTDALIGELRALTARYAAHPLRPRTIFVGGGTPTLLRPDLWQRLLSAMAELGVLDRAQEFTVEANPETVTPELMRVLAAGGVNRVSMGAQSFQPHLLKALERWHDPANVGKALAMVRDAGITNVNLDLIFAIPGETMADLEADLDAVLALRPTHLSCYSLIFEPHTPLTQKMKLGLVKPMDEETERTMYERVMQRLDEAGYEHYEISNWAQRPTARENDGTAEETSGGTSGGTFGGISGGRCQHNLVYWHNENWVGIGPAAASHVDGRRWKNMPHLGRYLAESPTPPIQDEEQLPADQRLGEQLMLGLRLREGVELAWLERTLAPDDTRRRTIDELLSLGLLERTVHRLRLTHEGVFLADALIAKLL